MNDIDRLRELAGIYTESEGETGDIVSKTVIGHHDHETDMMRKQLYQTAKYCIELFNMMEQYPEGDYPHWWQSKVIKAQEYISAAKHYMENELAMQRIDIPAPEAPMEPDFAEPEMPMDMEPQDHLNPGI